MTQVSQRVGYKIQEDYDSEPGTPEQEELLDEEEQDQVIDGLRSKAHSLNFLYRILFSTAGFILSILFFYLGYTGEEFGGLVSSYRATIVHTMTGLGCIFASYRALTKVQSRNEGEDLNVHPNTSFFSSASTMEKTIEINTYKNDVLFWIIIGICVLQILAWAEPIYTNLTSARQQVPILIFPMILPAFVAATEYALYVIVSTDTEVSSLRDLKYHYKKL
jgi:hypothetical protein